MASSDSSPEGQTWLKAFLQAFERHGWRGGQNVQIDVRWAAGNPDRIRDIASEFVAIKPDVVVANGTPGLAAMKLATSSIPIVFVLVNEPVEQGFIANVARPGGNITGFSTFEPAMGSKWLELLREAAPALQRIGCILDPGFRGFAAVQQEIETSAPKLGLEVTRLVMREKSDDIEAQVAAFGQKANGGLIVFPTAINDIERSRLFAITERHRLPAIYPFRHFAVDGGLMAYGFDPPDLFRRSASYIDRVLKGAKPADLPVQGPDRFELIINSKAAKTIGLTLSPALLARADEVIE